MTTAAVSLAFTLNERETDRQKERDLLGWRVGVGVDGGRVCWPDNLLTIWQEFSCKQTATTSVIWPRIVLQIRRGLTTGMHRSTYSTPRCAHIDTHIQLCMHTGNTHTQAWKYLSRILSTLCKLYVCCGGRSSAPMSGSLWQHQRFTLGIA